MFEQVILFGSQEFERNPIYEIERVVGHNFASCAHKISKEILDQNIQWEETEPCNINRGFKREIWEERKNYQNFSSVFEIMLYYNCN